MVLKQSLTQAERNNGTHPSANTSQSCYLGYGLYGSGCTRYTLPSQKISVVGSLSALPHRLICFSQRGYPLNTSSTRYITDPRHCPSFAILEHAANRTSTSPSLIRHHARTEIGVPASPYLAAFLLATTHSRLIRLVHYLMTAVLARACRGEALLAIMRRGGGDFAR